MDKIIGIDLGTSTSEVTVLEKGQPIVIKNDHGNLITPSIVGVDDTGHFITGQKAKQQLLIHPERTVQEVKRLMGTDEKVTLAGKEYTPQQIQSELLKQLKKTAEVHLGQEVERAVITVPAYFNNTQRQATIEAGQLAGLKVERIINEPTAAALTYGLANMEKEEHILVYDLGGGTFDVTLLELFDGVLDVKASSGDNHLGGKDFDKKIMDYVVEDFKSKYEIDLGQNIKAMVRLKKEAESCKVALSTQESYAINLPFIAEKEGNPLALDITVTRDQFEELIAPVLEKANDAITTVLTDSELKKEDIDLVLLVGGSTRIPLVRDMVTDFLGKEPKQLIDPDLSVAMGAAIQGGILNEEFDQQQDILITDVCPFSMGIDSVTEMMGMMIKDYYSILIERNTTIPVTKEEIYSTASDGQTQVEINVYQGEKMEASKNTFIGSFMLSDIPPAKAGQEKIKVKFSYDMNGMLQVEAQIVSTGKNAGITINTAEVIMEDQLEDMELDLDTWTQSSYAKKYKYLIKRVEKELAPINLEDLLIPMEGLTELEKAYLILEEDLDEFKRAMIEEESKEIMDFKEEDLLEGLEELKKLKEEK